jgi:hypothetical protein
MILTGIKAFEARWLDLRQDYPTSREDNTLIAHAMGQLVDGYETPGAILQALPEHLVVLFEELAKAYFNGYTPLTSVVPTTPVEMGEANLEAPDGATQDIVAAIAKLKAIAQRSRGCSPGRSECQVLDPSEVDTLIVDFPDSQG